MAVYAVGDIQGCYKEFRRLLANINFRPSKDRLMLVGDLVNRGPNSLDVLRFVLDHQERVNIVLGNHELHMLVAHENLNTCRRNDTFFDVLEAPDCDEIMEWLRVQPLAIHDKEHDFIMVHAGIYPQWTLEDCLKRAKEVESVLAGNNYRKFFKKMYGDKPGKWSVELAGSSRLRFIVNAFTRMRFLHSSGKLDFNNVGRPNFKSKRIYPWFNFPSRKKIKPKIVFGHWSTLGVYLNENIIALDSGCCWGSSLSAARLDSDQVTITQIKCR